MRLLLDTHALLWWWDDDAKLSDAARAAFDRMLAAQAQLDRLTLVSRDPVFAELRAPTLW